MPLYELNGLFIHGFHKPHSLGFKYPPPVVERMSKADINPRFLWTRPQNRIGISPNEVPDLLDISLDDLHTI